MPRRMLRAAVPVFIVAGGIALLLHGARASSVQVTEMREEQRTIEVRQLAPPPPTPPPTGFSSLFGLRQPPPPAPLPPAPPPIRKTVTIEVPTPVETREPELVREVTVGGVIRLANGELKRTYTGHAPSLCPT